MKKLTVKEIAQMAGVSVTAVSFVLNDKPGVSEETRQKIKKIIEETGFKPNQNSKKLVMSKSFNISLVMNSRVSPFDDLFYFEITRGILSRSREYGYSITITKPVGSRSELPDSVYSGDTDGLIFMQDVGRNLIEKAQKSGVPFVVVDSHSSKEDFSFITPDYFDAAHRATEYLIRNGHSRIAMIASDTVPDFYKQTRKGFLKAMKEHNLPVDPELTGFAVQDEKSAYEAAKALFANREKAPTAVFCTVDIFMIGAVRCARDLGYRVPEDISFIGIDDILLSSYVEPPLTTMGIDKKQMGILAMDMLLQKIKGKPVESMLLPMELIERKSVKKM